jgi:hypothetical protein
MFWLIITMTVCGALMLTFPAFFQFFADLSAATRGYQRIPGSFFSSKAWYRLVGGGLLLGAAFAAYLKHLD